MASKHDAFLLLFAFQSVLYLAFSFSLNRLQSHRPNRANKFHTNEQQQTRPSLLRSNQWCLHASGKGFGAGSDRKSLKIRKGKIKKSGKSNVSPEDSTAATSTANKNTPYVKAEQNALLEQLAEKASRTELGRVVAEYNKDKDPFWELIPSLIASKFPQALEADLQRIAAFVQHTLTKERPSDWLDLPHRPYDELHAYMPGLDVPTPFLDPHSLSFCKELEDNYDTIVQEYQALKENYNQFQSVTSMNYESGWKTLVLFYNGHRIPKFPYHLCPTTTRILETLPIAGRIAGFNRQQPETGIPMHTDGNNLWLTCQMGIDVPEKAFIEVAGEQRNWENGRCIVYDTTFAHKTWNPDPVKERVVLHVDFFNTLALTKTEISVLQYIYKLREDFMKAEGVAKVGAQVL